MPITLEERVDWLLVYRAVEDQAVGSGRELVWTMVTIVEQAGHAIDVDVVTTSELEARVVVEQAEIASASRRHECGGHLCVSSRSD